jgi:hypothetical protein
LPLFVITPKEYFDRTGLLLDSGTFDPNIDGFQKVSDSHFEWISLSGDPERILLMQRNFMWRDMVTEIKYAYKRERLLGLFQNI